MTQANSPKAPTDKFVATEQELRALYGDADGLALRKSLDHIDKHARAFIAASPFVVLATMDRNGRGDASPRGDPPGFVETVDKHHLLLPDRPGNNRLDSMLNLLENPSVGLLFLIPGIRESLRVSGTARIICDPDMLAKHAVDGKMPRSGLLIRVEEMFLHCAKALMRSKLWKPETWPEKGVIASPGRIWSDHINDGVDAEELDRSLERNMPKNLY
jgi:PPOX class probable FMN-dependent enzyme